MDHYLLGRRWYLAGRYRDALTELKAALDYDPNSADLLYNVARVYENLGQYDDAIAYYQRYLERVPASDAEERDRTQKTIRRLQGAKHELQSRRGTLHDPAYAADRIPSAGRADFLFWLTGGAACAVLVAGGVTGVLALKKSDQVEAFVVGPDGSFAQRQKLMTEANRFALVSDGLFIGGAVALTTAALLYFLRDEDPPTQPSKPAARLDIDLDGRHAGLSLHGTF